MEGVKILKIFYRNFFLRGVLGGFLGDFFGGLGCENIGLIDKGSLVEVILGDYILIWLK